MKSIILIIISAFTIYSCKKFENDPFYSTYTVKSRLTKFNVESDGWFTKKWVLTEYKKYSGDNIEVPENVFTLYFSKGDTIKIQNGSIEEYGDRYANVIYKNYKFSSNKDAIIIDSIGTFWIKKLTVVDLELADSLNNRLIFKLKSTENGFLENYYNPKDFSLFKVVNNQTIFKIGDTYQGGIIGYIFQEGDNGYVKDEEHGIICIELGTYRAEPFSNPPIFIGTTESQIGSGEANTSKTVSAIGYLNDPNIEYAAKVCYNLINDGYDDWFLPSINELRAVVKSLNLIPRYHSSTEFDSENNYQSSTYYPYITIDDKYDKCQIIAIRYF